MKKEKILNNPYLILIIPGIFLIALRFFGFDGLYGQDSYEYLRYTKAISEYLLGGVHPGSYQGSFLYPLLAGILSILTRSEVIALQIVTILSFSICFLYGVKLLKLLYPNHQFYFTYIIIFGIFSPFFLKISLVTMSDTTAAMFVVISFYYFFKAFYNRILVFPTLFFATCAFMTRHPSLFILLPIIIYSIYLIIKRKDVKDFLIAIISSSLICILYYLFHGKDVFTPLSNYFLNSWSFSNYFKSNYITQDGLQSFLFPNIIHSLYIFIHPGYIFIGVLLCILGIKKYKTPLTFFQKILALSIILYLGFLSGIPLQNTRILGLLFPIILILLYPSFSNLINLKYIKNNIFFVGVVSICIQLLLWAFTFRHPYKRAIFEKEIVTMITSYQGEKLYSFDVDIALQGRGLNFEYKNMFLKEHYDFELNDLVLFHPTKFQKQWSNKNPMINWIYINKNYTLEVLEELPEGWKLYKIKQ